MVRKKLKKPPTCLRDQQGAIVVNDCVGKWLSVLNITASDVMPAVLTQRMMSVDVLGLLNIDSPGKVLSCGDESYIEERFSQIRRIHRLRERVLKVSVEQVDGQTTEELFMVFLAALLLYVDPRATSTRKTARTLFDAAEKILGLINSAAYDRACHIVDEVAQRLVAHIEGTARAGEVNGHRAAASLMWLASLHTGRRALLEYSGGMLICRSLRVLGEMLEHHHGCPPVPTASQLTGRHTETPVATISTSSRSAEDPSEILKTVACLLDM